MRRTVAVALAALMVLLFAAPAHAAPDGQFRTGWYSIAFDGTGSVFRKEIRTQFWWDKQSDGTGVCAEFLQADTVDGGVWISGYDNVNARWFNYSTGHTVKHWFWGHEGDDFTKNHDHVCGPDNGTMDYTLRMCNTGDELWWRWRVWSSGQSELITKGHEENPDCL